MIRRNLAIFDSDYDSRKICIRKYSGRQLPRRIKTGDTKQKDRDHYSPAMLGNCFGKFHLIFLTAETLRRREEIYRMDGIGRIFIETVPSVVNIRFILYILFKIPLRLRVSAVHFSVPSVTISTLVPSGNP